QGESDPGDDAERRADGGEGSRLREELAQHVPAPRAERLPQADLAGALRHGHQHDVHDHDAADHERHDHHAREDHDENAADPGPKSLPSFSTTPITRYPMPPIRTLRSSGVRSTNSRLATASPKTATGTPERFSWAVKGRPMAIRRFLISKYRSLAATSWMSRASLPP